MENIIINYIRVDFDNNIFLDSDPGRVKLNPDDDVQDIIKDAREKKRSLGEVDFEKIEVYRLETPVPRNLRRSSRIQQLKKSATATNSASFEELKKQIEEVGIENPLLEFLYMSDLVSDYEWPSGRLITAIVYHPVLADDYETVTKAPTQTQIQTIHEERTFTTARIDALEPLTETAPHETADVALYDHVFMGHPYYYKALPVALYSPILAEFTYKVRNLHATGDEAKKLFPFASDFHEVSRVFCREAAGVYAKEKDRSKITFKWLNAIFGEACIQQVSIPKPVEKDGRAMATKTAKSLKTSGNTGKTSKGTVASDSSHGSKVSYAKPDGVVVAKTGSPSKKGKAEEEVEVVAIGGVKTKVGQ